MTLTLFPQTPAIDVTVRSEIPFSKDCKWAIQRLFLSVQPARFLSHASVRWLVFSSRGNRPEQKRLPILECRWKVGQCCPTIGNKRRHVTRFKHFYKMLYGHKHAESPKESQRVSQSTSFPPWQQDFSRVNQVRIHRYHSHLNCTYIKKWSLWMTLTSSETNGTLWVTILK